MTRRNHANMPKLREGCFPAEGWQNPPFCQDEAGDSVQIRRVKPKWFSVLPVFDLTGEAPELFNASDSALLECIAPNGWRFFILAEDSTSLRHVLTLATAGRGGLQHWMSGVPWQEALAAAENAKTMRERQIQAWRDLYDEVGEQTPPIDIDDIEI